MTCKATTLREALMVIMAAFSKACAFRKLEDQLACLEELKSFIKIMSDLGDQMTAELFQASLLGSDDPAKGFSKLATFYREQMEIQAQLRMLSDVVGAAAIEQLKQDLVRKDEEERARASAEASKKFDAEMAERKKKVQKPLKAPKAPKI